MARKATTKSTPRSRAKAAVGGNKDAAETLGKKAGFGKRSMAASAARTAAASPKPTRAKSEAKPKRTVIGRAVGTVASTVSGVAESAASLFKRKPSKA